MHPLVLLPHRGRYPYSARLSRCGRERAQCGPGGQRRLRNWARLGSVGCGEIPQLAKRTQDFFPPLWCISNNKNIRLGFYIPYSKVDKGNWNILREGNFYPDMSLSRLEFRGLDFLLYILICIEVSSTKPLAEPTSVSGKATAPRDGTVCIPDLIIVMSVASWILSVF